MGSASAHLVDVVDRADRNPRRERADALTAGITIGCIYGLMYIGLGPIFGIIRSSTPPRAICSFATYNCRPADPKMMDKARQIAAVCARHGVDLREAARQLVLATLSSCR